MSKVKTKIELIYRKGQEYKTVPIGTEIELVEFLPRRGAVVAQQDGREFILEKDQFEDTKNVITFRPPVRRKKKEQTG